MKNEKNFLITIIITMAVLITYPMVMKQFFPQFFPAPEKTIMARKTPAGQLTLAETPPTRQQAERITYSKNKSYVIRSRQYAVTINTPGADIKRIELMQLEDPATQQPTVLMDTQDIGPGIFSVEGIGEQASLEDVSIQDNAVTFTYNLSTDLKLTKKISLDEELYSIVLDLDIKNMSSQDKEVSFRTIAATGIKQEAGIGGRFQEGITILANKKMPKRNLSRINKEEIQPGEIRLAGFKTRYFTLALAPLVTCGYSYSYRNKAENPEAMAIMGVGQDKVIVSANSTIKQKYILYAGPSSFEEMSKLELGIEDIRGKGFFAGFSDLFLLLLRFLHKIFRNYGVAVIGLALTINLVLYPLTLKSLKSMKELQAIQPLVEKMRKECKDNPQKLNKETMELYKKHKVNPAGGCFPMLLQMPVFFALYGVLMKAIELRGAGFLWIKDLSGPDALFVLPQVIKDLPLLGNFTQGNLNLLPLIMIGVSFVQQKLTTGHQGANDQQKAMALMMPVFLGFIFYNFPSGLVLYFLTNTIFSFVVQMKLKASTSPAGTQ